MRLDLALLYRLFDIPEDEPVRRLARAADREAGLCPLVLSLAVAEGHESGSGSADVLARQRRRARVYRQVRDALLPGPPPQILKGEAIARLYPAPALRPVGDLDLLVAGTAQLWEVATTVLHLFAAQADHLTRIRVHGRNHYVLGISWPSEDPLVESDYQVEVVTLPYVGDLRHVPPTTDPVTDPTRSQMFAVVEERFQRAYTAKDVLDCAVLLHHDPTCLDTAAARAEVAALRVAPELHELLAATRAALGGAVSDAVQGWLAPAAEREIKRRAAATPMGNGWGHPHPDVRYGLKVGEGTRPTGHGCELVDTPGGELLLTPAGDFLLVEGASVAEEHLEAATEVLRGIDPRVDGP